MKLRDLVYRATLVVLPVLVCATAIYAGATAPIGCKNAQQAENAVFTGEQIVCMVVPLVDGLLTGTPEEIASDIVRACPALEGFTTEVVQFVNQWIKGSPAQKQRWKEYVAASHKGPQIYPVADARAQD